MSESKQIILYHYPFSPYARKIVWYLQLRGLEYAQCLQPAVLPRPDLELLSVKYRRIPLCSIGRDVYTDTRLILRKLEELFPSGAIGAQDNEHKAIQKLLERWTTDGGVFNRAAQLIPPDMPLLKDPKFLKDRTEFSGRTWSSESQQKGRPEALVHIRDAFSLLETTLLADGRDWILKGEKPSLADIDAIWPFDWLLGMKGAIPSSVASESIFPKVFAWIKRFNAAIKASQSGKAKKMAGPEAAKMIVESQFAEQSEQVDAQDPLQLQKGELVEVWPIDSGFAHRDQGRLVSLTSEEVVIAVKTTLEGKEIHLHMQRWGFRIARAGSSKL